MKSFIHFNLLKDLSFTEEDFYQLKIGSHKQFRIFRINKRNGGYRTIYSPTPKMKLIQTWLMHKIFRPLDDGKFAQAFRPGASVKQNAKLHANNSFILKYDIENFFPTITYGNFVKVIRANKTKFRQEVQDDFSSLEILIKDFCFLKKTNLPQGFCSSPCISNIFMKNIDVEISSNLLNISEDITYSRYADDISISFNKKEDKDLIDNLVKCFFQEKTIFNLNQKKTKFGIRKSGSMFVNGIKIAHDNHLTIHRNYKDKIRRLFYVYKKQQITIMQKRELIGHVYYVRSIDPIYFNKIHRKYLNEIRNLKNDIKLFEDLQKVLV